MATRSKAVIKTDINAKIISNGNISATDTNQILKDILDCRELNTQPAGLSGFKFKSEQALEDNNIGTKLYYSLRGVNELFVNVTLRLLITESSASNFEFKHEDPDIAQTLKNIVLSSESIQIDNLVKIKNNRDDSGSFRVGNLNFSYDETSFYITIENQSPNDNIFEGDEIFTSFVIHCPSEFGDTLNDRLKTK